MSVKHNSPKALNGLMRISIAGWLLAAGIILEGGGWDVDPKTRECFAPATAEHYEHDEPALACSGNCTMESVQRDDDSSRSSSPREQVRAGTRRTTKTAPSADPRGRVASAQAASVRRLSALPMRRREEKTTRSTTRPGPSRESSLSSRNSTTSRASSKRRRELTTTSSRTPARGDTAERNIDADDPSPEGSWTDAAGLGTSTPGEMTTTPTRNRTRTRSTESRGLARDGSTETYGTHEHYDISTRTENQPEQDPTDRQPQYDEDGREILDDWHEGEWSQEEWAAWMQSEHQPEEQAEEQEESDPQAVCVPFPQRQDPEPDPLEYFTQGTFITQGVEPQEGPTQADSLKI